MGEEGMTSIETRQRAPGPVGNLKKIEKGDGYYLKCIFKVYFLKCISQSVFPEVMISNFSSQVCIT